MLKDNFIQKINIISILIINFIFILLRLPDFYRPLWNDEYITIRTTQINPLVNPLYNETSTNLPLYYYFIKIFSFLFTNENLRISSLIFSIVTLNIFLYRYLKEQNLIYLISGIMLTFIPIQIYYSVELRTYALTQLLLVIQFFYLKDYLERKKVNYIVWGLIIFLSLISHYTSFIFVFATGVFLLLVDKKVTESLLKSLIFPSLLGFIVLVSISGNQGFTNSTDNSILNLNFDRFSINNIKENILRLVEVLTIYYNFGLHYYRLDGLFTSLFKKFMYFFYLVPFLWVIIKIRTRDLLLNVILVLLTACLSLSILFDLSGFIIFASRYIFPFNFLYILLVSYVLKEIFNKSKFIFFILITIFIICFNIYNLCLISNLDIYKGNEDPQGILIQSCFK